MSHPDSTEEPLLLRVEEAARLLGLGRTTVFAMLARRELPLVRIGRSVRVPRDALERWIHEHVDVAAGDDGAAESPGYAIPRVRYAFRPGATQPRP